MDKNKQIEKYLIELVKASVLDCIPPEIPDESLWGYVTGMAEFNLVDELVYDAIGKLDNKPSDEIMARLEKNHQRNMYINLVQLGEGQAILDKSKEAGLEIMPLKGFVFKKMYNKPEHRQMGDIDYLVDGNRIKEFGPIMKELAYTPKKVDYDNPHDEYIKKPYVEIEIHRRLIDPKKKHYWFVKDIWDRRVKDQDGNISMTPEDFYLYHLIHFEKHLTVAGSGMKALIDQYFVMKKYREKLDWNYINENLKKLEMVELEEMCRKLCKAWFEDGEMDEDLDISQSYIINSGAYGTFEQRQKWFFERYQNELGVKSKKGFLFRRIFMERELMETVYPSLKKHRWLLPFLWVRRWFRGIFFYRNNVKKEIKYFFKNK